MPPKNNKLVQSKPSKTWKFIHEDSPDSDRQDNPKQKNKKTKSEVKGKTQEKKIEFSSVQGNRFSSIIDKFTALQQQKIQARKRKSDTNKTQTKTSRQPDIQKQAVTKSTLKKSQSQKPKVASNLKNLQSRQSTYSETPFTPNYPSISERQTVFETTKKQSQYTVPSQSQMFAIHPNTRTESMFTSSSIHSEPQRRLERRPSLESQWNRSSQIRTQSRIKLQYDKFFDNSENVFIEQSSMIKEEAVYNYLIPKVSVIFVICFLFWLAIGSISPYSEKCPRHATCGAYINCHEGYILNRELKICQIDPKVKQSGLAIMSGVIQDLKYEWGMKECTIPHNITVEQQKQYLKPPLKSFHQIFTQLDIKSDEFSLLRRVLTDYFQDRNQQVLGKFKIDYLERVQPGEKLYSLSCRVQLFYEHHVVAFIVSLFLLATLIVLSIYHLSRKLLQKKAQRIYQFLKEKAVEKKEIDYAHYRLYVQEKFNRNREISYELWDLINKIRINQKIVGSYEVTSANGSTLLWKFLEFH